MMVVMGMSVMMQATAAAAPTITTTATMPTAAYDVALSRGQTWSWVQGFQGTGYFSSGDVG